MAGKNTFRAKTFASSTFTCGTYNGLGVAPPVTVLPTVFLVGNAQHNVVISANAQRNVKLTADAGSNS